MISFYLKTISLKAIRNFTDYNSMERHARSSNWLVVGTLLLGMPLQTRSQVAFLGEGSVLGSVGPGGVGTTTSQSEFIPSSSTPLGMAGNGNAAGDNFNSQGTVGGTYGIIATLGGMTGIAAANADYPAAPPNQAYFDIGGLAALCNTRSIAAITVSDLVFDGPSSTVTTRLNFLFSSVGNYALSFNPIGKGNTAWGVTLSVQMPSISGPVSTTGRIGDGISGRHGVPGVADFSSTGGPAEGLLMDYTSGTVILHSPFVEVPTGVPLTMSLNLDVAASASMQYGTMGTASVTANVGFPGGGVLSGGGTDLFDLPSGYNVTSAAWQLHANALGGGGGGAVPEPQEYAAVFSVGLLGFAAWRRRTRSVRTS